MRIAGEAKPVYIGTDGVIQPLNLGKASLVASDSNFTKFFETNQKQNEINKKKLELDREQEALEVTRKSVLKNLEMELFAAVATYAARSEAHRLWLKNNSDYDMVLALLEEGPESASWSLLVNDTGNLRLNFRSARWGMGAVSINLREAPNFFELLQLERHMEQERLAEVESNGTCPDGCCS